MSKAVIKVRVETDELTVSNAEKLMYKSSCVEQTVEAPGMLTNRICRGSCPPSAHVNTNLLLGSTIVFKILK